MPIVIPEKKKALKQAEPLMSDGILLDEQYEIQGFLATKLRPHQIEGVKFMFDCIMGKK